ncbi:MAG TPA: nucleoside triphosphate pyrophosphohydrolase [Longimicrobiales bacterium]
MTCTGEAAISTQPNPPAGPARPRLDRALDLVRFLRSHCPWDAAQTPRSLLPYLLEEAHEVAEAVTDGDDAALPGELGDLLLNLAFQIVLAEERGAFDAETVVARLEEKMRRRHPQIYGDGAAAPWEALKAKERGPQRSLLADLPRGLDPLSRAHRIQERVSAVGFDWEDARGAFEKVAEELEEVRQALEAGSASTLEEELGDLLFAVVNLTRLSGAHALGALQGANRKFIGRFEALERLAAERGVVLGEASLEELDRLWEEVKRSTWPGA